MIVLDSLFDSTIEYNTAVTVGKFDGIHKGHNLLCNKVLERTDLKSCMVAFTNAPKSIIEHKNVGCLITKQERIEMLRATGFDYIVSCPFDERMMNTSAEDFISTLRHNLKMSYIVCGSDFRFGYKGAGDIKLLDSLSKQQGFEFEYIDKLKESSRDISSTFIKEELELGHVDHVNELLGYEYFVYGKVVHGRRIGHTIGIPTINITPPEYKLLPKFGVYETKVEFDGKIYMGVTNVGIKPTVTDEGVPTIETHIIDFSQDIYDEYVKVTFLNRIRGEMKFANVHELQVQMLHDIAFVDGKK